MSEAEGVSKSFDPRFSRAFQPGYDPRVHREEPPGAVRREEPRIERASATAVADGAQADEAPVFAVPGPADTADGVLARSAADRTADDDDDAYPIAWWRRVNPWYFLLWALGAVFIAAGIAAVMVAVGLQTVTYQTPDQSMANFIIMQMTMQGAPMLIVLGIATLTSTAVIQAARWQRR